MKLRNNIFRINITMKTVTKAKINFKSAPQHQSKFYIEEAKKRCERIEYQLFVVPWQMIEEEESEVPVKHDYNMEQ